MIETFSSRRKRANIEAERLKDEIVKQQRKLDESRSTLTLEKERMKAIHDQTEAEIISMKQHLSNARDVIEEGEKLNQNTIFELRATTSWWCSESASESFNSSTATT